jgi:predicted DNA repair protein MutK
VASGLAALLDDVALIAKAAAASIDDLGAAASKAGMKAAGVVIDDTAVTPRYVTGFTPDRELPVIAKIARGSLRNKLLILLPAAVALSAVAAWALTPLLMLGGAYLCYEGAEKLLESVHPPKRDPTEALAALSSEEHERVMVAGAVRTDFILSAEIMAIALADVSDRPILTQAVVLAVVAVGITVGVYGAVGLIVKMDDLGLQLVKLPSRAAQALGRALLLSMPWLLSTLSAVGVAAMSWVGGGIVLHGLHELHLTALPGLVEGAAAAAAGAAPFGPGLVGWLVEAVGSGGFGVVLGGALVAVHHAWIHARRGGAARAA